MYPHVTLKIKNHTPQVVLDSDENTSRNMTNTEESIYEVVINIARKLNLIDRELEENDPEILPELLDLARQSDEMYIQDFPEIETENVEFDLSKTMNSVLNAILEEREEEYVDLDIAEDIKKELNRNQNSDIFASLLDIMYMILIAKTLVAAAEVGIGTVRLEDEHKNPRLVEKMAKELERMGVEFIVI
jgi:hypothetical protein